jgi:hypothetical protein
MLILGSGPRFGSANRPLRRLYVGRFSLCRSAGICLCLPSDRGERVAQSPRCL